MAFIIQLNTLITHDQTYMQEMHYFSSFISIENGKLYNGYSIQENVTLIYSINNLEYNYL